MGRHRSFFAVRPEDEDQRPIDRATVRRVIDTFRPYKAKVTIVAVLIVVTSALGVVNPMLISKVFNDALFGDPSGSGNCGGASCPNLPLLYFYVALMIAVPIVTSAIGIGQTYMANLVGLRVMQDLRNALYSHLQFMPLRFFTTTRTGEIQSRIANDVGGVQSVVTDTASSVLANIVTIISTLAVMIWLSVPLTILSLALMPLFLWLTVKVGRARRDVATSTQRTLADLSAITEETLSVSGILLSKSFGRQRHEIGRYQEENERLTGLQIRQTMIGRSFFAVVGTFFSITPALVYLVAGWQMSKNGFNSVNAGDIVAFTTLQSRLFFPIGSMLQVSTDVHASFALFDRIFEYLDLEHEIEDKPGAIVAQHDAIRGKVALDHVRFRYEAPPEALELSSADLALANEAPREWTLDDVSFEIQPGQLAALVGPSGAGKTTVTYLVPRLYDVQRGRVLIDDVDVRDYHAGVARRHHRRGDAGDLPVPHHDPAQPDVRAAGGDPGGDGGRRACREHPRPDRRAPRGLRHDRGGARLQALGRGEAAPRDRARGPEGPADPDPRRGHVLARHDVGTTGAVGAGAADGGPYDDRDRPPALDDPEGRRDLRDRPGPGRRARHARSSCSRAAVSTHGSTSSSSAGG